MKSGHVKHGKGVHFLFLQRKNEASSRFFTFAAWGIYFSGKRYWGRAICLRWTGRGAAQSNGPKMPSWGSAVPGGALGNFWMPPWGMLMGSSSHRYELSRWSKDAELGLSGPRGVRFLFGWHHGCDGVLLLPHDDFQLTLTLLPAASAVNERKGKE